MLTKRRDRSRQFAPELRAVELREAVRVDDGPRVHDLRAHGEETGAADALDAVGLEPADLRGAEGLELVEARPAVRAQALRRGVSKLLEVKPVLDEALGEGGYVRYFKDRETPSFQSYELRLEGPAVRRKTPIWTTTLKFPAPPSRRLRTAKVATKELPGAPAVSVTSKSTESESIRHF